MFTWRWTAPREKGCDVSADSDRNDGKKAATSLRVTVLLLVRRLSSGGVPAKFQGTPELRRRWEIRLRRLRVPEFRSSSVDSLLERRIDRVFVNAT